MDFHYHLQKLSTQQFFEFESQISDLGDNSVLVAALLLHRLIPFAFVTQSLVSIHLQALKS